MAYRAALITGAAKRLGKEMALALAARGISIAVHYNGSKTDVEACVTEIEAIGGNAVTLQADLLLENDMQGLVGRASKALGKPLDILINNASVFEYDTLETATLESWDRHINSNLRAPFVLTQQFAKQAPKASSDGLPLARAAIINMVDQRVRKLNPHFATYTLAKSALWTLTQTSSRALAPDIRVNAIGPGPTMQAERQSNRHFNAQRAATILERGSNAADIVSAMHYLLDAPSVTGQLICTDGGQHLGWKTPDIGID